MKDYEAKLFDLLLLIFIKSGHTSVVVTDLYSFIKVVVTAIARG